MSTTERDTLRASILIAEDDPDDQLMLQDAFSEAAPHCQLHFVSNGVELMHYLARAEQNPGTHLPDLLLLDLNMPLKDGRQALQELRANPTFTPLPVVILTTSNSDEDRSACIAGGANGYLVKPPSYKELLNIVASLQHYWGRHD